MKYFISIMMVLSLSGCLMQTHHQRKTSTIKKEIELLELKKRKAILQFQLVKVENLEVEELEKGD